MDFSEALKLVKLGYSIQRKGWNGKGMWVTLVKEWAVTNEVHITIPFLAMKTVGGFFVPWLASQTDILADDWDIA